MTDDDQIAAVAALHHARSLAAGPAVEVVASLRDPIGDDTTPGLLSDLARVLASPQVEAGRRARTRLREGETQ